MPLRSAHSCTVDLQLGVPEKVQKIVTSYGVIKILLGRNMDGVLATRSVQIPITVPIAVAQELCRLHGGRFSPATPAPTRSMMSEGNAYYVGEPCLPEHKGMLESLVKDFEMPVDEDTSIELSVWSTAYINALPDSAFVVVLPDGRRLLPYKNANGMIDKVHVRNALARVNQMAVKPGVMKEALKKLLRIAKAIGIRVQDKSKYKLSDFQLYLDLLEGLDKEKGGKVE